MKEKVMIFGHRNPDTDSVTSAIALSYLKNKTQYEALPCVLGDLSKESEFVLDYFNMTYPHRIDNVKIQLKDLLYDRIMALEPSNSILAATKHMNDNKIRTLPIVDSDGYLIGIVTMKDIAMSAIHGDLHALNTTFSNIKSDLKAETLNYAHSDVNGKISITAFHDSSIIEEDIFDMNTVVITGDRFDIIDYAIQRKVQLIVVTGNKKIPELLIEKAAVTGVNMIKTPYDTYYTSKLINQTNFVSSIMKRDRLVRFKENEYLENCREIIQTSKHSKFPLVDEKGRYLGIIGRTHFLNPTKKNVILVDHNEYAQSAEGLSEANVIEIIDHHKIGDISTSLPIAFRNMPVGSTNTIIYQLFKEEQVEIPKDIAGLMMSGIISDTLFLKSPTTTVFDEMAVEKLTEITGIKTDTFALEMFKKGTSLVGKSVSDVFFNDFKEFMLEGCKIAISQVFTLNFQEILDNQLVYFETIKKVNHDRDHYLTLMVVTDIIKEGSYMLFESKNDSIMSLAFEKTVEQGTFIENCVSRKKQIIPKLIHALGILK
ncbi:putative manganese-dependent inorganic diphosphatase [Fusibacter ferrireducens]|uniref:inorganic diphosphatase n=1 Tax=Fusibacter ferrireducens TaxID=2785058 RepID=A0ABR9ZPF4_9FIRM|nr:putative manganese-dependent inorganic diphosphatase [Fusibacter ferrireducens]MBF4691861.1 putative manganese-dependent inorganic diphosphatase [Fusibacter ferrireducens]